MRTKDRVEKFVATGLKPGERVYVIRLTGHEKVADRKAVVHKMNLARHRLEGRATGKELWDLFKIWMNADPNNEYDPFAVEVWVSLKSGGEIQRHQIGFVKANHMGKSLGHNRTIFKWISEKKIIRTVVLDIGANPDDDLTWVVLGVIVPFDCTSLAKKCKPMENYGKEGKREKPPELDGVVNKGVKSKPKHEGKTPVSTSANYPTQKEIDTLITLHVEFEDHFGWEEVDDGETFVMTPVFMSQWNGELKKFQTQEELDAYTSQHRCYGTLENAVDLREIEEEYGPVMASAYYLYSGKLKGPLTGPHTRELISIMEQVNRIVRESPLMNALED